MGEGSQTKKKMEGRGMEGTVLPRKRHRASNHSFASKGAVFLSLPLQRRERGKAVQPHCMRTKTCDKVIILLLPANALPPPPQPFNYSHFISTDTHTCATVFEWQIRRDQHIFVGTTPSTLPFNQGEKKRKKYTPAPVPASKRTNKPINNKNEHIYKKWKTSAKVRCVLYRQVNIKDKQMNQTAKTNMLTIVNRSLAFSHFTTPINGVNPSKKEKERKKKKIGYTPHQSTEGTKQTYFEWKRTQ
uniref:Uncharacterized protein TCIL3000_11_11630 n=1 Tax=Trypanosoma congolense (strain IL3000) TaxID=1068625 RepID=G0V200_TRYCI|nr:unnamed protein product [Trypanosoma congolense IL3000]